MNENKLTIAVIADELAVASTKTLLRNLSHRHPPRNGGDTMFKSNEVRFVIYSTEMIEDDPSRVADASLVILTAVTGKQLSFFAMLHADGLVLSTTTRRIWPMVVLKEGGDEISVAYVIKRWRRIAPGGRPVDWFWNEVDGWGVAADNLKST